MRFIAFDLETTGTLPGVDRIVEIGAVRFVNSRVEAVYSTLVDPRISIPEGASRVNGITDDMLRGKPFIEDLLASFAEFCGEDYIVAHNAPFDFQFLKADIERFEAKAPTGDILDTFVMSKKVLPGLANYKLSTLIQHLNIPAGGFHRAEEDASYCGQLFLKLVEKISGQQETLPRHENLLALHGGSLSKFPQIEPQPKQLNLMDGLL